MPIKVTCPKCQGVLHAPDDAGGKKGKCPTCGVVLQIPMPGGSPGGTPNLGAAGNEMGRGSVPFKASGGLGGGVIPPEPDEAPVPSPYASQNPTRTLPEDPVRRPIPTAPSVGVPFPLPPTGPAAERPYRGSSTFGSGSQLGEPRKPGEPFAKVNKNAPAIDTEYVVRMWRRMRAGLWWVQAGYFFAFVSLVAYAGLDIALMNGLKLPQADPGYLQVDGMSQQTEIRAAAVFIPAVLAVLCLVWGRFFAGAAPASSLCRGLFKAAGYFGMLTFFGIVAATLVTGSLLKEKTMPQLMPSDDLLGQIQRAGLAVAAVFAPLSELLFVVALGRLGSGLQNEGLAGRGTRFLLLAGLAYAGYGLWTYAKAWYGPEITRLLKNNLTPNLNQLGEQQGLVTPILVLLVAFLVYLLYARLVGAARLAIRDRVDSLT